MRAIIRRVVVPLILVACFAMASAGCYRQSIGAPMPPDRPPQFTKWNHQILWGIIGVDTNTDANAICHGSPERVSVYVGPVGLLLGIITAGIYVPTTTSVWCH